jgi:hypothetical protein
MAVWVNRTVVQAPRNGTNSHTVSFAAATSGNLLVLVMEGAVTHTVPTGWTRQVQALMNTELSVYTKTASSGESSFDTTHNGSNYPIGAVIYELPSGSTWVGGVSGTNLGHADSNPNLTGLTGSNLLFGAVALADPDTNPISVVWSGTPTPTEDVDINVNISGTDGYALSIAYAEYSSVSSFQPLGFVTWQVVAKEALTFAISVPTTNVTLSPSAIASGEAFGTATVVKTLTASPSGIASAEAFGTPVVTATLAVSPSGIASGEAFGTVDVAKTLTVGPSGIASAGAFGTPTVTAGVLTVSPAGIASAEAFGTAALAGPMTITTPSIASAEVFGTATVVKTLTVSPSSIGSAVAFGTASLTDTGPVIDIRPGGIGSMQTWGTPTISGTTEIAPSGILSAQAWGTPVMAFGPITIAVPSLASPPSVMGTPVVGLGALDIAPAGITSTEAFGYTVLAGALAGNSDFRAALGARRYGATIAPKIR